MRNTPAEVLGSFPKKERFRALLEAMQCASLRLRSFKRISIHPSRKCNGVILHPPHIDTLLFSKNIEEKQRTCDHGSFFVDGHVFEELDPLDIAKHNCGHLINVIDKLTRYIDREMDSVDIQESSNRETVLKNEVTPDLLIYAIQIATAFKVDWLMNYAKTLVPSTFNGVEEISSLADIVLLQAADDAKAGQTTEQRLQVVRKFVVEASSYLARICDKHDHGTDLPTDEIGDNVTNILLRESLRMAHVLSVDMDEAYDRRIDDIKRKYGNVRIFFGKE